MTSRHYDLTTLYEALRAGLLTWAGIQASQEARYTHCANGCAAAAKWRTLDDRELCGACYAVVAAEERQKVHEVY